VTDYLLAYAAVCALVAAAYVAFSSDDRERFVAICVALWPLALLVVVIHSAFRALHRLGFRFARGRHVDRRRFGVGFSNPHPGVWLVLFGRAVAVYWIGRR
jgi:hypothetical protein